MLHQALSCLSFITLACSGTSRCAGHQAAYLLFLLCPSNIALMQAEKIVWVLHQPLDWGLLPRACLGVLALLAGNGYIVGINQIYDVDIDTVSKPFLPIAAGALPTSGAPCSQP